ncbi:hypothetical protein [Zhihengliuella halotolerans]|uniref:Uncharacterized protein n=1 Tax=Zhihengliuella halotolerans TaxID=370736 RepID=A0A4V2G9K6_9MICC|nr:hypothetical protein [Zhihengliuella halotolerans]RZU60736.1 hypothetical protein EV380_0283 [Zhihengliuella halotolerans]
MSQYTSEPAEHGDDSSRPTEPIDTSGVAQPTEPITRAGTDQPSAAAPIKNTVPLGTLIFGLIVFVLGALTLGNQYLDIVVNPAFVTVSILIGAGLIMVVGGISAARRNSTADRTNMKG